MVSFIPGRNFSWNFRPASETNPLQTKLSITWIFHGRAENPRVWEYRAFSARAELRPGLNPSPCNRQLGFQRICFRGRSEISARDETHHVIGPLVCKKRSQLRPFQKAKAYTNDLESCFGIRAAIDDDKFIICEACRRALQEHRRTGK